MYNNIQVRECVLPKDGGIPQCDGEGEVTEQCNEQECPGNICVDKVHKLNFMFCGFSCYEGQSNHYGFKIKINKF